MIKKRSYWTILGLVALIAGLLALLGWKLIQRGPSRKTLILAAIANLSGRTRENARDGFTYAQIGLLYAQLHRWDDAIRAYRKACQLSPSSALAWTGLGQAYFHVGKPGGAMRAFGRAAALRPGDREILLELARAYILYRRYPRALAVLDGLIHSNPRDAEAYTARASVYYGRGDRVRAFADARTALRIEPGYAAAHFMLTRLYTLVGKYAQAEAAARRAIELAPDEPDGYVLLADVLAKRRSGSESNAEIEQHARKSLALDRRNALAYYFLGLVHMRERRYRQAERELRHAVRLDPRAPEILSALGQTLVRLGDEDEATKLLRQSERIKQSEADFNRLERQSEGNPNPQIHLRLAEMYYDRGMFENADEHIRVTVKAMPKHRQAKDLMERIRHALRSSEKTF